MNLTKTYNIYQLQFLFLKEFNIFIKRKHFQKIVYIRKDTVPGTFKEICSLKIFLDFAIF